ncbi:prepilin-type N-terminal cleavage/methylation domain-containing protein [Xanthomonas sp. Kuri4-1]
MQATAGGATGRPRGRDRASGGATVARAREGGGRSTPAGGFTLIELMVAVAVLAITLALAIPSFTSVVNGNRLLAQSNELVASLQLARSEAIRRNAKVVLCPSDDGSSCRSGSAVWTRWIVQVAGTGEVLRVNAIRDVLQVRASATVTANGGKLAFYPDGLARDASYGLLAASVAVCLPTARPDQNQRRVTVASGSRVATLSENTNAACATPADA